MTTNSTPSWIDKVQSFEIPGSGLSASLKRIAESIDGDIEFSAGELAGAVIDSGAKNSSYAIFVSTGDIEQDRALVERIGGVPSARIQFVDARTLIASVAGGIVTPSASQ